MQYFKGAVIGIVGFLIAVTGVVMGAISFGFAPMCADRAPSTREANLAMQAVHAVSERELGERRNPVLVNSANLALGLQVYRHNCLMCHGAADGKASNIAQALYVRSPQFASDGAEDDPEGATYWKVYHGIRFTAMPPFRSSLSDLHMWQVAVFLKHMDHLPNDVTTVWKSTESVGVENARSREPMHVTKGTSRFHSLTANRRDITSSGGP